MAVGRAVVLGASGLVGGAVARRLREAGLDIAAYGHGSTGTAGFDLADPEATGQLVAASRADLVVLAAAYANVDGCERDPAHSHRVNVEGSAAVADACERSGAQMVWFSTDYVFDGMAGPYGEDDVPRPLSVYGRHKLAVEQYLAERLGRRVLVVRTTGVYGSEPRRKNFALGVVDRARRGEAIRVPDDQVSTPTYAADLADLIGGLVEAGEGGVWNVAGSDCVARSAFARSVLVAFGLDPDLVEGCTTTSLGQSAVRPLAGGLRTDRVVRRLGRTPMGVNAGLRALRASEEVAAP